VVLVTNSEEIIEQVNDELERQLVDLPRKRMAQDSLDQSYALLVDSIETAFDFSNRYAPEHLILSIKNSKEWLGNVQSAGSVFVGPWSPEVAGDYASGTNHTLPTSGSARSVSGVSMDSYVKKITFQELSADGLSNLAPTLRTMAEVESLEGHSRAVKVRLKDYPDNSKNEQR
jgi:histidinol dehydrogenase